MKQRPIIIVGGGIGGLSAAIRLAARGLPVTLFEGRDSVGGKLRQVQAGEFLIDSGPTVLTLRSVFEDLFNQADARFEDYVSTQSLDVLARHAWPDGSKLDLFENQNQSIDAIGDFAGAAEAKRYQSFCRHAQRIYATLESTFIKNHQPGLLELIHRSGLRGLPGLVTMNPFMTMWRALTRQLRDPRLQQLFARYATYCGSSPFEAPAVLMLIAHVEQTGVWSIDGGMQTLAVGCEQLATELGCRIQTSTTIREIQVSNGRVCQVVTDSGECHPASAVVFNGDPSALATGLLGENVLSAAATVPPHKRSLSAVTFSLSARTSGFTPHRHNVFFSPDYVREFDELFHQHRLPTDPTVYVCAQNRGTGISDHEQNAAEPLFCLVNAPAYADITELTPSQIEQCQNSAFDRLQQCGLKLHHQSEKIVVTGPSEFQTLFPGTGGALYGQASHHWRASFNRPACRTSTPGLYLAGGATHPGPGVPMAAISGQLAAETVLQDMGLT